MDLAQRILTVDMLWISTVQQSFFFGLSRQIGSKYRILGNGVFFCSVDSIDRMKHTYSLYFTI